MYEIACDGLVMRRMWSALDSFCRQRVAICALGQGESPTMQ